MDKKKVSRSIVIIFLIFLTINLVSAKNFWNGRNKHAQICLPDKEGGIFCYNIKIQNSSMLDLIINKVRETEKITNQSKLNIFGTEYISGQIATIWLVLTEGDIPINNATCFLDVYTPSKEKLISRGYMQFLENGIYYYDLNTINFVDGVYLVNVMCKYRIKNENYFVENISGNYSDISGEIFFLNELDNREVEFIIPKKNDYAIYFEILIPDYNLSNSSLALNCRAYKNRNYNADIHVYNFNTSSWEYVNYVQKGNDFLDCGALITSNGDVNNYINDSKMLFMINGTTKIYNLKIRLDLFRVERAYTLGIVNNVRGGGEIHITNYNQTGIVVHTDIGKYTNYMLLITFLLFLAIIYYLYKKSIY